MRVKESNRERERGSEKSEREREREEREREREGEKYILLKLQKKSDKHVWVLTGMTFKVHI